MQNGEKPERGPILMRPWPIRIAATVLASTGAACLLFFAPAWLRATTRAVAAYDLGILILLIVFWTLGMHGDARKTKARASIEDPGRNAVLGAVIVSVAVALSSAISILGRGPNVATTHEKLFAYLVAIVAVALGWTLIQTMFTLRYAHLFYYKDDNDDNDADRGLIFPGTTGPNDYDFAYFSFVIGMTYQVSDVQISDGGVRRVVLVHSLISFVYNTVILALGVNIISGLLH